VDDMQEKMTISIPKELYEKAEEYIKNTGGFESVEELIVFMLEELVREEEETSFSPEEEEEIKKRLRSLGYI